MNTLELKNILISEIAKIDDESFLSALKTILDSRKPTPKNYAEQYNEELKVAEQEIQNGNFYSHNEVKDKIEQWKKK
ncbi:hypothetical protein SD960_18160 [Flavobacterium sp. MMLR14_040]|jgi:hypothetical protein|uniref:hypothetical protein n=1 Tax=Flavobacterium sp. MMLR14_040 TaxID=3093843 RepID=UPI00298F5B90|nr:hypothetical protein [Flavobacterium sp. MMLR14_040]MDW8852033.1 hypothetical protein [Flavobacterium sp. MMLR14_040]